MLAKKEQKAALKSSNRAFGCLGSKILKTMQRKVAGYAANQWKNEKENKAADISIRAVGKRIVQHENMKAKLLFANDTFKNVAKKSDVDKRKTGIFELS